MDISDNEQNLIGNTMTLGANLGEVTETKRFLTINPSSEAMNVDPDIFGNAGYNVTYHSSDVIFGVDTIPQDSVTITPNTSSLGLGGSEVISLYVTVPNDTTLDEGKYTGKIWVIADTGGALVSSDTFDLEVYVGTAEAIDVANASHDTVYHNETAQDTFTVENTGNTDLYNIIYSSTDFVGVTDNSYIIPASSITFDPATISELLIDDTTTVKVNVPVPFGMLAQNYQGTITVKDDDGYPLETIQLTITALPKYDVDISDNEANLVSNKMSLSGAVNETISGKFRLINPNSSDLNVDPDAFGNANWGSVSWSIDTLTYNGYFIPTDSVKMTPPVLASGGTQDVAIQVAIPSNQYAATYAGKVSVTAETSGVAVSTDTFLLNVTVGTAEAIALNNIAPIDSADHGTYAVDSITVKNIGNADLDNIVFETSDLVGTLGGIIPEANVSFIPTSISQLNKDVTDTIGVKIFVPLGTLTDTYTGPITVKDDDGYPLETVNIIITVNPSYDLDISDNGQNLVGNIMSLTGDVNTTVSAKFLLINPNSGDLNVDPDSFGNAGLSNITYVSTYLVCGTDTIPADSVTFPGAPTSLASGIGQNVTTQVAIPFNQQTGTYTGTVTANDAVAGVSDNFILNVTVGAVEDIDITTMPSNSGNHGEVINATFTVLNSDAATNTDADGPGNTSLDNLQISCTNLTDTLGLNKSILNSNITFEPSAISYLESGDSIDVTAKVNVPLGTYATTYKGLITVNDDDGLPKDTVSILITVNPSYDLDIKEVVVDLGKGAMGDTLKGTFRLINPNCEDMNVDPDQFGNTDLDSIVVSYKSNLSHIGIKIVVGEINSTYIDIIPLPLTLGSGAGMDVPVSVRIPDISDTLILSGIYEGQIIVKNLFSIPTAPVEDTFKLRLQVIPAEKIDIAETTISDSANHGETATTTFKVANIGNIDLNNIKFEATNLTYGTHIIPDNYVTFIPTSVSIIPVDDTTTVTVNVDIPLGTYAGIYTGILTATDDKVSDRTTINITVNPSYDLDIADNLWQNIAGNVMEYTGGVGDTLEGKFFRVINPNNPDLNVDPDDFGNADLNDVTYSVDTLKTTEGIIFNGTVELIGLTKGTLLSGESKDVGVKVTISDAQQTGTYEGIVRVWDNTHNEATDQFKIKVRVTANENVNIVEGVLADTVNAGAIAILPFNVKNDGSNVTLYNLDLIPLGDLISITGGRIPRKNINFTKPVIDSLSINATTLINLEVKVPNGMPKGTYTGWIEVRDHIKGVPNDSAFVSLNVLSEEGITVDNNPVTAAAKEANINFLCDNDYTPTLTIINMAGTKVIEKSFTPKSGAVDYTWYLKNEAGKNIASGLYIVIIKTKTDGKEEIYRKKLLVIR